MIVKTKDLSGAALDWAVAKCEVGDAINEIDDPHFYSSDWAQGGPIIERGGISLECDEFARWHANGGWSSDTPLLAAMRCYVVSKLGDEVEVPDEWAASVEYT